MAQGYVIPILAADIGELIWIFLFLIITVGGWLANAIKESQEKKNARNKSAQPTPTHGESRLDELAERRRRQIEELTKRRRGQRQEASPQSRPEPNNLTMSERIAREQARQQYERRAETLRREREAQQRSAQQAAQRERERVRVEQQRRAAELVRRQAEQQQLSRPAAPPLVATAAARAITEPWQDTTQLHGDDRKAFLTLEEMRRGIVLKEILDPPLALRPPQDF